MLGAYGAVDTMELAYQGEAVTVDSGHVVGYDAGVQSRLRRVGRGASSIQSMKSGEGSSSTSPAPAGS